MAEAMAMPLTLVLTLQTVSILPLHALVNTDASK